MYQVNRSPENCKPSILVTGRRGNGNGVSDRSQNLLFRFANEAVLSSPDSVAETALVSRTGFQPVADGEQLENNPPLGNCQSSIAARRRMGATEPAGCLSHCSGCRSAPEFGPSRGPATAIKRRGCPAASPRNQLQGQPRITARPAGRSPPCLSPACSCSCSSRPPQIRSSSLASSSPTATTRSSSSRCGMAAPPARSSR